MKLLLRYDENKEERHYDCSANAMLMLEEEQAEANIPISQSGFSVTTDNGKASATIKPTKGRIHRNIN